MIKKLSILIAIMALLSGCQMSQATIGKGPITLSPGITSFYKDRYLKQAGPAVFVVSKDGRYANYIFCSDGPGVCRSGIAVATISDKCKARANAECFIFDEGGFVVWDGPVSYANSASNQNNSFQQNVRSERTLCVLTTRITNNQRAWETVPTSSMMAGIAEAQSRGLTLDKCSKILGDKLAKAEPNAQSSTSPSLEESLETIKRLLERGLITDEEAKLKRADLLNKIN